MNCSDIRKNLLTHVDGELDPVAAARLDEHLSVCASCAREYRLVSLPRRIGRLLPALEPSPYFYRKLRTRLDSESQSVSLWQIVLGLARPVVPALAAVTLALLSVFAYEVAQVERQTAYQAYDHIFMSGDRPQRMVIAELGEITEESVLQSLTEDETARGNGEATQPSPRK
jgi:anti-sigma factor RsiW